jgi:hypothetical protein
MKKRFTLGAAVAAATLLALPASAQTTTATDGEDPARPACDNNVADGTPAQVCVEGSHVAVGLGEEDNGLGYAAVGSDESGEFIYAEDYTPGNAIASVADSDGDPATDGLYIRP